MFNKNKPQANFKKTVKTNSDLIKATRKIADNPFLNGLLPEELNELLGYCKLCKIKMNEVIMYEGDIGDAMFFLVEGVVNVTKNLTLKTGPKDYSSMEKAIDKLDASKAFVFGEMAMFENDVRSATITAATDCLLFEIKRKDFEELAQKNPRLGYILVKIIARLLCERVRKNNQDILKLTTALSIALTR